VPTPRTMPSPRRNQPFPPLQPVEQFGEAAERDPRGRSFALKHALDRIGAVVALLVVAPILLVAAVAVKVGTDGPVIVRERRIARDGRSFTMLLFQPLPLLQRFAIDQLPQLVNVLLGQMSFVGPRPERPEFVGQLAHKVPFYEERHFVKPGVTGWAQVRYSYGASEKDAQEKLEYDLYYVKHHSLVLDLIVLLQTVEIVLFRIGSR
jgi:lipopolysaccharide/colanic/teichoic acid biosynthesis glycosyltransferase